jgi:signal transduction histidine kinase
MAQKEKFASLGEMAAGVAHGFRNSLATIGGYLQLLENKISPDCSSYTSAINREFELLQKVVNDFLSFARPVQLQRTKVNLEELVRECGEEVRIASMSAPFVFSMGGTFPQISGDETALRQVFTNLLLNAAESIDGTGRKGKIEMIGSLSSNSKHCVIEVRDNGAGISPEDTSRIFTPFFSTKEKGVGLGLAIVQKLILQHNGSISVESTPNGSVFRVQLLLEP